jgi:hypothetical protein
MDELLIDCVVCDNQVICRIYDYFIGREAEKKIRQIADNKEAYENICGISKLLAENCSRFQNKK